MARRRPRWRRTSILRRTLYARRFNPKRAQVELVQATCARFRVNGEDLSGDVVWALYQKRGFLWDDDRILDFTVRFLRNKARSPSMTMEDHESHDDDDARSFRQLLHNRITDPETACEASMARDRIARLPDRQREAIMILADGGTPLDIASEFGIKPWDALVLISEARDYIGRV